MPNTFTHVGPSLKYASQTLVYFLSLSLFNPTRVLCFLTWYMENEITFPSGKKDLAPSLRLLVFKGKKITSPFND